MLKETTEEEQKNGQNGAWGWSGSESGFKNSRLQEL